MFTFEKQNQIGKDGENLIDNFWMTGQYSDSVEEIIDVSEDKYWQRLGVDRLLKLTDGRIVTLEYKTDKIVGRTGNIVFELISNNTDYKPGWGFSSQAQVIVYLDYINKKLYIINTLQLRELALQNLFRFAWVEADNFKYKTISLLIPVSKVEQLESTVVINL